MLTFTLPGGLPVAGGLLRQARLRPLSTALELLLAEATLQAQPWPQFVSQVLSAAVASLDEQPFNAPMADALCVADRHFLMLQLAQVVDGDGFWVTAQCAGCGAHFDLRLARSALPIKTAGDGFPAVEVQVGPQRFGLRVPTGADQAALAVGPESRQVRQLLQTCLQHVDGQAPAADAVATLDAQTLADLDAALDDVAPDIGQQVQTQCPECGQAQVVALGTQGLMPTRSAAVFDDIRRLAHHCHWSEADIVAMPRARRLHYLRLVDEARALAVEG